MSPLIDIPDKCMRMMVFVSGLGYLLLSSLNPKSAPEQEISFHNHTIVTVCKTSRDLRA